MKHLAFVILLSVTLTCFGQTEKTQLVTIIAFKAEQGCMTDSYIGIIETGKEARVIEFDKPKRLFKKNGILQNEILLHKTVQDYLDQGYDLISHTNQVGGVCGVYDKFLLTKKE